VAAAPPCGAYEAFHEEVHRRRDLQGARDPEDDSPPLGGERQGEADEERAWCAAVHGADVRKLGNARKVPTLEKAREVLPDPAKMDGALAAQIFAALDRGVSPVKVVIDLGVHPDVVEAFHAQRTRMNGVLLVSEKTLEEITGCPGFFGSYPIETEEELLEAFRGSLEQAPTLCTRCRRRHGVVCTRCTKQEAERIVGETEARVRPLGVPSSNGKGAAPQGGVRTTAPLASRGVERGGRGGMSASPQPEASTTNGRHLDKPAEGRPEDRTDGRRGPPQDSSSGPASSE
jgi:hypothetical protein